jgi:hypothetical protein
MANNQSIKCAIFDIEGCLANNQHRENLLPAKNLTGPAATHAWDKYYSGVTDDAMYRNVVMFCNSLVAKGLAVLLFTGIPRKFTKIVTNWLADNSVAYSKLLMRHNDDIRSNAEVKFDMLQTMQQQHYQPVLAVDDMPDVLDMFNKQNIRCFLATKGKLTPYSED